jgi:aspartyl aminopeptidase
MRDMQASVPIQEFVSRQDMGCGSTIGPIAAQKLGTPVVGMLQTLFAFARWSIGADVDSYAIGLAYRLRHCTAGDALGERDGGG